MEAEASEAQLDYLDSLRDSGITNMFSATPYLIDEFDIDEGAAKAILLYWMRTYSSRHPLDN